ncbi:hypothetical protein CDAR_286341 [Caerostris darwini]|uniref:Uncharacterized protein n=1 Tax=Caerostris darwini TaxID=1538125 RepID=A0AAV4W1D7_9ARAC|nr:hypothetical protein CDAR_286341 [Caerostris darwini]
MWLWRNPWGLEEFDFHGCVRCFVRSFEGWLARKNYESLAWAYNKAWGSLTSTDVSSVSFGHSEGLLARDALVFACRYSDTNYYHKNIKIAEN